MIENLIYQIEIILDLRNYLTEIYASTDDKENEKYYTATILLNKLEEQILNEISSNNKKVA